MSALSPRDEFDNALRDLIEDLQKEVEGEGDSLHLKKEDLATEYEWRLAANYKNLINGLRDLQSALYEQKDKLSLTLANQMFQRLIETYKEEPEKLLNAMKAKVSELLRGTSSDEIQAAGIKLNIAIVERIIEKKNKLVEDPQDKLKKLEIRQQELDHQKKIEELALDPAKLSKGEANVRKHLKGIHADFVKTFDKFLEVYNILENLKKDPIYEDAQEEIQKKLEELRTIRAELALTGSNTHVPGHGIKEDFANKFIGSMEKAKDLVVKLQPTLRQAETDAKEIDPEVTPHKHHASRQSNKFERAVKSFVEFVKPLRFLWETYKKYQVEKLHSQFESLKQKTTKLSALKVTSHHPEPSKPGRKGSGPSFGV